MKRIFISAGEPSGDLRASELVRELLSLEPSLQFIGMGGPLMEREGVHLIKPIGESSVVGIQEAVSHIPSLLRDFRTLYYSALQSDAIVLVDYPGYHLLLASKLISAGKKVFYYILPQIWAWGRFRGSLLRRMEGLYSILPFEREFFDRLGIEVKYFGHPLSNLYERDIPILERKGNPVIGLLPGSRKHEIRRLVPRMMKIKGFLERRFPDAFFYMSLVDDSVSVPHSPNMEVLRGKSLEIIKTSDVLIVASGTASLETAILGKPAVVLYAMSEITWLLANMFARVRYVSLTNLILGREVYPEFVQHINPKKISEVVERVLENRDAIGETLRDLRELIGGGNVVRKVADDLLNYL